MMTDPLVSIGIVTWNNSDSLSDCLRSILGQDHKNWELIVVDNASSDASPALAAQLFPEARVIRNINNTGFCHAHNQAILASNGSYYLALNPDVIMQPGYISVLVSVLEAHPDYGSCAGKLLQSVPNGQAAVLDSTGLFIDRQRRQYLRGHAELDAGQYEEGEIFGVDGAAPLYRRAMLDDTRIDGQYFDEAFFVHKEDVDLAWRARLLGWRCWYAPQAVAVHPRNFRPGQPRERSSPAVRLHAVKNRYLLIIKNESRCGWWQDGINILWYDLKILGFLCLFERSTLKALTMLPAIYPRARSWRREIWKRVKVEPGEIQKWFHHKSQAA
jgi:GT2 family glycosyltransferase